jgi:SAM-dependent methyltransferase
MATELTELARNWETLARHDAMWAILSDPNKTDNRWNLQEFLATGKVEAQRTIDYLDAVATPYARRRLLDFGCGMGRVTQGFAAFFDRVDGLDVSAEMVARARDCNQSGDAVQFHVSHAERLPFDSGTFDVVYTALVLQHVPLPLTLGYLREFLRIATPGGVVYFQAPSRCLVAEGDSFASPIDTIEGRVQIDMNVVPRARVEEIIQLAGAVCLDVRSDGRAGPAFESLTYCVRNGGVAL